MKISTIAMFALSIALGGATTSLSACAADEAVRPGESDASTGMASGPAPVDADAAPPCTEDREYFPAACSTDILCPNGLFDPAKPSGGSDHFDARTRIHLIRGRSANDVWAVGALGALAHYDGTSWARSTLPPGEESPQGLSPTMRVLWLRGESEVGIANLSATYTRGLADAAAGADAGVDAGEWVARGPIALERPPSFEGEFVMAGWAAPGSDALWLSLEPLDSGRTGGLARLHMTASNSVRGDVEIEHFGTFNGVHGASAEDVWAVGMNGGVLRIGDASSASPSFEFYDSQTRNALYGVWAASESDVWAVGYAGTIRHYTGDPVRWDVVADVAAAAQLNAIWGSSASDVWAVGNDAIVLHYDGARWTRMKVGGLGPRRPDLTTVWTTRQGQVWIGGDGELLSLGGTP